MLLSRIVRSPHQVFVDASDGGGVGHFQFRELTIAPAARAAPGTGTASPLAESAALVQQLRPGPRWQLTWRYR